MRQLKKPQAQAIKQQEEDDELDEMPFLGKGAKRKRETPHVQVNTRSKDKQ